MKYFTKYLPVEGEIKEGDMFLDRFGKISKCPEGGFLGYGPDKPHGDKKVKLFLCSRDIQVGDKVRMSDEAEEVIVDAYWLSKGTFKNAYKVIGEISPDALSYVKEGQEFEENEVKYWPLKGGTLVSYKIKGPCGHFH